MKKYKILLLVCIIGILGYLCVGVCDCNMLRCFGEEGTSSVKSLSYIFISILAVMPFVFVISDTAFCRWIAFAVVWFLINMALIVFLTYTRAGLVIGDVERSALTAWMSIIFVISSVVIFTFFSVKEDQYE